MINPMTGLEEDDELQFASAPAAIAPTPVQPSQPAVVPQASAIQNPTVREYLLKRKADRDALEQSQSGFDTTGAIAGALASLGAGFQGKDSVSAGQNILAGRRADQRNTMADFDKSTDRELGEMSAANETDAESADSKAAQEQIATLFPSLGGVIKGKSKAQIAQMMPLLSQKIAGENARETARIAAGNRAQERQDKLDEKMQGLKTPFGYANSEDDAKKLKEAYESKQNFDNKIKEMIDLREKHGGGALLNREDVARGKQLSKDLLLEYKNMAKLGVLSAADEKIINAIIPADPLEYNSPLAAIQGQDPILNQLKRFKGDSDKDFQTRVATRTRAGKAPAGEKTIVKTQTNKKTGEKRIVYSDGSTEIVSGQIAGR